LPVRLLITKYQSNMSKTCAIALVAILLPASAVSAQPTVEWRLELPFRLFKESADWERLKPRPCYVAASEQCDKTLEEWYARVIAERSDPWPEASRLEWTSPRLTNRGEYEPGNYSEEYLNPRLYRIVLSVPADVHGRRCHVTNTPEPISAPCSPGLSVLVPAAGTELRISAEGGNSWTVPVKVTDHLVVGIGDSYASGEGNPDRPARLNPSRSAMAQLKNYGPLWIRDYRTASQGEREASWLDDQCHRSLYSHQSLAAMWLASQDPHRAITFVHLACSGAEINDGLLQPQSDPPGGGSVARGQLPELKRLLCKPAINNQIRQPTKQQDCRAIELLMLSVGGNDVGFARFATHLIAPLHARFALLSPAYRWFRGAFGNPLDENDVRDLINTRLAGLYSALNGALGSHIRMSESGRVLITEYPIPLFREDGSACGRSVKDGCNEALCRTSMFELFGAQVPGALKLFGPWQFQISGDGPGTEHSVSLSKVIRPLNRAVNAAAALHGWTSIGAFGSSVLNHGMCAVSDASHSAQELGWTYVSKDGQWTRADPTKWNPYAERPRWFRTVHDSVLTQFRNDKVGMINGTMHPTARTHAAVAAAIVASPR
jgi:hypothetical protein